MTNKFFSSVDGNHLGIASDFTPRFLRLDSLSIVSRQSVLRTYSAESSCETFSVGQSSPLAFPFKAKSQLAFSHQSVLPILLLCLTLFIGVGQMWGATETVTISTIASANSWTNGNHYSGWTSSSGKFTFTASNTGQGLYYSSDNSWRGYKSKGSMVITAGSGITISSVTSSATASWSVATGGGSASFTPTATIKFTSFTITYTEAASKTLSSISVQTAPTKKKYVAGETFDPTGLVITRTYSDKTSDTYAYAGHTSDFTFSPTTSASLTTSNTSVSITYGGKSTSQSINVYNVTMQARDEEGNTIPSGGPGAPSRTGKSITPAADANNYVFKEWSVENAELGSSETTKSNTITSPEDAVTVTAVYYKPITITYMANSQTFTTQTYGYGGTLAFPASGPNGDTYSCTGKTFVGWVAETNKDYSHATNAPTYAAAGGSVTTEATYYAVFAKESDGGSSTKWVKTQLSNIDEGTYALITTGGKAFNGTISSGHGQTTTDAFSFDSNNEATSAPTGTCELELQAVTGGFKIYNATHKYLYAKAASSGNLEWHNSESSYWSYSSSNWQYKSNSANLRVYNNTFRTYSNSSNDAVLFAKKVTVSNKTYSNYLTTCCTQLGSINGSFNRYHLKIFHHIIMSMFISLIFKC